MARPRNDDIVRESGAQQGLSKNDTRMTFIIPIETAEKLRAFAYTKNMTLKDTLTIMVDKYIEDYEKDPNNEPILRRNKSE